jgi:hypothetical protein
MISDYEAAASGKTYRSAVNRLAGTTGIPAMHTSSPLSDFERMNALIRKRDEHYQEQVRLMAEAIIKAGGHPRFPRFE